MKNKQLIKYLNEIIKGYEKQKDEIETKIAILKITIEQLKK